jgi:dTDP-4-dehydrorhamnose 3,5-epimerase
MEKPNIIKGGIHRDKRGQITFFNDFDLTDIKRFYVISNHNSPVTNHNQVRAWQGHKIEEKHFYCTAGSFLICAVLIDDWDHPSQDLKPTTFVLNEQSPQVLYIPPGYANGVKALGSDSKLIIFSNLSLEESAADTYRFDPSLWYNWSSGSGKSSMKK